MSFSILQLNDHVENFVEGCNYESEIPGTGVPLEVSDLKQRVKNYKEVMINDYGVDPDKFSQTIPVGIENVLILISKNWKNLAGVRIYLSKKTRNKDNNDYELILVPCEEKEVMGRRYFQDKINEEIEDSHVFVSDCRRPPDCNTLGALLIEP